MADVTPCKDRNAIKVVAFAFEFEKQFDENTIRSVISLYEADEALREDLPRKQPHQVVTFQMGDAQQVSSRELGGVTFDSLTRTGEQEWAIILRNNTVIVSCTKYTRWDEVWPKAKVFFNSISPVLKGLSVVNIGLEYVDEFIVNDQSGDWKNELFNKSSSYLTPTVFEQDDYWHSHVGFLSRSDAPVNQKILNVIEVNYIESTPQSKAIVIRTQHKSMLLCPLSINAETVETCANEIIEFVHEANKNVMRDLLSQAMLKRIGLEQSSC